MSEQQQQLDAIDEVIAAFDAVEPADPRTLTSAFEKLRALPGQLNDWLSIFLQQHCALFYDIDLKNPVVNVKTPDEQTDEIVRLFMGDMPTLGMHQPDINLDELANSPPEDVTFAKRFALFALFCLKLMVVFGVAGGSWYNIRQLGGDALFTGKGQGAAIGSGAVAAISEIVLTNGFDQFTMWLTLCPAFEGENISELVNSTKIFVTSLLGATTWFGVLQILQNVENQTSYQLFGLFGLAFFWVGAINASGNAVVGKSIVAKGGAGLQLTVEERQTLVGCVIAALKKMGDKKTVSQLLLSFALWYSYWDYYEGFLLLAKTRGHEQAILWGTLVMFFEFAGFGNYGIEKAFAKRSAGVLGIEAGLR